MKLTYLLLMMILILAAGNLLNTYYIHQIMDMVIFLAEKHTE